MFRKCEGNKQERSYLLERTNLRQYKAKALAVASRRFLKGEKTNLKIKRENEWKKL
jgi:hypothetical protein